MSLLAAIDRDGIEFLFAMFVDLHGKPCAKLVPASAVDQLLEDGRRVRRVRGGGDGAGALVTRHPGHARSQLLHPRSVAARPGHLRSATRTARVSPGPSRPGSSCVARSSGSVTTGLTMKVGAEAEYFLVRRSAEGGIEVADPLDRSAMPCYDARALTRMYDHLTTVSRHINELGWANYANDHEDANGQFEQNFRYADPLTTADRVIVFRYMVHALAAEAGMLATFMPKPFSNLTGNGLHLHLSLWGEDGSEVFADGVRSPGPGVSSSGYSFIGGLLDHARGADRRHLPDGELLQAPGQPGAQFGCGLVAGLRHLRRERPDPHAAGPRRRPGREPLRRRGRQPLPGHQRAHRRGSRRHRAQRRPRRALRAEPPGVDRRGRGPVGALAPCRSRCGTPWSTSKPTPSCATGSGKTPDGDYLDYYVAIKRDEFHSSHREVTNWELDRYLSAI